MSERTLERNRSPITDNIFEQFLYMGVLPLCIVAVIVFGFMFY
jgi:hypothetical protein